MNNTSTPVLIALFVGLIGCIIYYIFTHYYSGGQETEVVSNEDDPQMKAISDFRTSFVNNVVQIIGGTLQASADELHCDVELVDWNNNLITILYKEYIIRLYIDWRKGTIKIAYTLDTKDFIFVKSKKLKIKNHTLNYEKFEHLLEKWYAQGLARIYPTENDRYRDYIAAAQDVLANGELTDKDYVDFLLDVLVNYTVRVDETHIKKDSTAFVKLMSYILKYHADDLQEYVKKLKEDEEENEETIEK